MHMVWGFYLLYCHDAVCQQTYYRDTCGGHVALPADCNVGIRKSRPRLPPPRRRTPPQSPYQRKSPSPPSPPAIKPLPIPNTTQCTLSMTASSSSLAVCSAYLDTMTRSPEYISGLSAPPLMKGCDSCVSGNESSPTCRIQITGQCPNIHYVQGGTFHQFSLWCV